MDITAFLREDNILSPLFIILAPVFFLYFIKQAKCLFFNTIKNLPPGPPKLPLIGNLHQVGEKPHVSTASFGKEYGPLVSLRLGAQVVVVASSPEAAKGILKTQDRLLSSRTVPSAFQHSLLPHSILFADCTESWKNLKSLCRTELFSSKALEAHTKIREEKVDDLLEFLCRKEGEVIDIQKVVYTTLFNGLSCIMLDKDLLDLKDEHEFSGGLMEALMKIIEFGGLIKDFGSFFPMLQRFDLHGVRKGCVQSTEKAFMFWEHIIEDRRARVNSSTWSSDQAKCFLDRLLENEFSNNQINQFISELFIAGSNTTTSAFVWVMAELTRNKEVITKIKEEIKREMNTNKITMSQLSKLPYLQACVRESLRLHPPLPFILPRKASQTCEVMDYTIPKNATVLVNVWAIGRDPKVWDDPLSFKPERFLGSNLDYKGQHFELLPFGSGRRICPGLHSGSRSMEFILASLIHEFDWSLPNGEDPMKLNMNDKLVVTSKMEKPLKLVFKRKQA